MESIQEKEKHVKAMERLVRAIWVFNWFNSCGCTELLPVISSRFDMERFGLIPVGTPRHADCLIITGYQTKKSIKRAVKIYEQMPEPFLLLYLGIHAHKPHNLCIYQCQRHARLYIFLLFQAFHKGILQS